MSLSIGCTGTIASGKSTALKVFRQRGFQGLDTDDVAHECLADMDGCGRDVMDAFGEEITKSDGTIDRQKLGRQVFGDEAKRQMLNGILHPEISRRWRAWREQQRERNEHACVVIPLLFEVDADDGWDEILAIVSDSEVILERLQDRGLSRQEAVQRIQAQWSGEEKARRADSVIWNNEEIEKFVRSVHAWIDQRTDGGMKHGRPFESKTA